MKEMLQAVSVAALAALGSYSTLAWAPSPTFGVASTIIHPEQTSRRTTTSTCLSALPDISSSGSLHGQNACFLPLKQLDQDYFAPRIIQVRKRKSVRNPGVLGFLIIIASIPLASFEILLRAVVLVIFFFAASSA